MPERAYPDFSHAALDLGLLTAPFKVQTSWHVITGAPSCGKTTLINLLADRGFKVIPESARLYMEKEVAAGRAVADLHKDGAALQRRCAEIQLGVEARLQANEISFLDGAFPGCLAWFRAFGLDPNEILPACFHHRYASVFILDQLPPQMDGFRFKDEALAGFLDEWIVRDYTSLGYRVVRVPMSTPQERLALVLEKLAEQRQR